LIYYIYFLNLKKIVQLLHAIRIEKVVVILL
jgi:hypothetical protein